MCLGEEIISHSCPYRKDNKPLRTKNDFERTSITRSFSINFNRKSCSFEAIKINSTAVRRALNEDQHEFEFKTLAEITFKNSNSRSRNKRKTKISIS